MFDMAEIFAMKYQKDGHLDTSSGSTPQFFILLVFKILLAKFEAKPEDDSKFEKALQYLEENKKCFGIELEYMKIRL